MNCDLALASVPAGTRVARQLFVCNPRTFFTTAPSTSALTFSKLQWTRLSAVVYISNNLQLLSPSGKAEPSWFSGKR